MTDDNQEPNEVLTPEKITARRAAGILLSLNAGTVSASFDRLATWFLAGFGAGLALLVSQFKNEANFISPLTIASVVHIFICASVLCLIQRYIATLIECGASGVKQGRELGDGFQNLDFPEFKNQMLNGLPFFVRWLAKGQWEKLSKGDFAVHGRLMTRLSILQGLLVAVEITLLLIALGRFASELIP